MKFYYHSSLENIEMFPNTPIHVIPCNAYIDIKKEESDSEYDLLLNGSIIDSDTSRIYFDDKAEIILHKDDEKSIYSVMPYVERLSMKNAGKYNQFYLEYANKEDVELESIQKGKLKLYAVDQCEEVRDWNDIFTKIEKAFPHFKIICDKPKSHLKAINEVRPIETVKRIGYESIPYLAAHSEDWLARTASGLKPARLFSRVEDDEYQIYENKVVKTLIDNILSFLRKTEKQLRDQKDQLEGIMNSDVQTGSFGFDLGFHLAIEELTRDGEDGSKIRQYNLEKAAKLQENANYLLKKYRTLRQTRLYKYLRKSRHVINPLNETNILTMDKHYSEIFKLWKSIQNEVFIKTIEEEQKVPFYETQRNYQQYCATLCGYAAHVLGFEILEDGKYKRLADSIEMQISLTNEGFIKVCLQDISLKSLIFTDYSELPIVNGEEDGRFRFENGVLYWPHDISEKEIESFCSRFKKMSKKNSDSNSKYKSLKKKIIDSQRIQTKPKSTSFIIIPLAVKLQSDNRLGFTSKLENLTKDLMQNEKCEFVLIALPSIDEEEQKIIDYARESNKKIAYLPLTMFDINSFRRLQNVLYRQILLLDKKKCLNCGGNMKKIENQWICNSCGNLILTLTKCSNQNCKKEYHYLDYSNSSEAIQNMKKITKDNFFKWDSLFQYKNIVDMKVENEKIVYICPHCSQK